MLTRLLINVNIMMLRVVPCDALGLARSHAEFERGVFRDDAVPPRELEKEGRGRRMAYVMNSIESRRRLQVGFPLLRRE